MKPNVLAVCVASQREAVERAAGVRPVTSPPLTIDNFNTKWLHRPYDLLYFSLHGIPEQPYWYGDNWLTAISAEHFAGVDLSGAVVFVANCYLQGSPMEKALLDCHPKALIGGSGKNWTRTKRPVGANLLGWYVRRLVCAGIAADKALHLAKLGLRGKNSQIKHKLNKDRVDLEDIEANKDAMLFRIIT